MRLRWLDSARKTLQITCPEGIALSPTLTSTSTPVPTSSHAGHEGVTTGTPTRSQVSPTQTPRPTSTPTMVPENGSHNGNGFGRGTGNYGQEVGINLDRLNQLKAEATAGRYARLCTNAEHDRTKWHSLVNPEANCHYDHHHGDDPWYVADIFGPPGAWFGHSGWSISFPWQTFRATSAYESSDVHVARKEMENDLKHEGYIWIVRRNLPCQGGKNCVTDYRLQVHAMMGAGDFPVRYHSFSVEMRVCVDKSRPETCGIARKGGWADHGRLFTTPVNNNGGAIANCGNSPTDIHIPVPADNLFFRLETEEEKPWDEIRCHPQLNLSGVRRREDAINPLSPLLDPRLELAHWWAKSGGPTELRFQVLSYDPVSNINPRNPGQWLLFCDPNAPACDFSASKFSAILGYIQLFRSRWSSSVGGIDLNLDPDGNGILDINYYTDRWGLPVAGCTKASLDCIPVQLSGIRLNGIFIEGEGGYAQTDHPIDGGRPANHDISPAGKQWVTWFYRHAGLMHY
ncbi:MAG: hypothetical protein N2558_02805 [Patescibacteria group bacterium]|nr:hypothetical protein [Patescibacteria group bacterium]